MADHASRAPGVRVRDSEHAIVTREPVATITAARTIAEATYPITVAASHLTQGWKDRRSPTWAALCHRLTDHRVGDKAGPCFTPATFRGTKRLKSEADEIGVAVLDLDDGARSLAEIKAAVGRRGWAGIVYSTHSHAPDHPKYRLVIPLARPWRAADYPTQDAANAAWRDRVEALAAALRLHHDPACTDTSRLFFLPRHAEGATSETAVIDGAPCDVWNLPTAPTDQPAPANDAPAPSAPLGQIDSSRLRYAAAALDNECSAVRNAGEGNRNNTLNRAALKLGGLVGAGALSEGNVRSALTSAALAAGLPMPEITKTLNSGLRTGMANPRNITDLLHQPRHHQGRSPRPEYDPETGEVFDGPMGEEPPIPVPESANPVAAAVNELNSKYMVVNEAGKAIVYAPGYDPAMKRDKVDRIAFEDLRKLYMNRYVKVGTKEKGEPIYKPIADVWLHSPDRRQYIDGVVFDPSGKDLPSGVLNLWKGFSVKPKPGDWSLLRDHIYSIVCGSDPVRFNYLMGWMARMLQSPAEQGEVAVAMKGGEGSGKGTVANALKTIIGQHSISICNTKHLVGNFNQHLRDAIFLFADEAFFAGDKVHIGTLKSIITEPSLTIEGKGQNIVQTPNFLHVMMASNEDWVVPASLDSRRFFVLNVDDTVKGNHEYFGSLRKQLDEGGYEAMLYDLLAFDLTYFNVRDVPTTEGLQQQRKISLPIADSWWMDCLMRGYVFKSKLGLESHFDKWIPEISTELLYSSYKEYATEKKDRNIMNRETFGFFMRKYNCTPKKPYNTITGEHIVDKPNGYGTIKSAEPIIKDRACGYLLGSLELARGDFTEVTKLTVQWDPEDPDKIVRVVRA